MKRSPALPALGALTAMFIIAGSSDALPKRTNGWIVEQFHEINGKEITYISRDFVRLERVNNHYTVLIDERKNKIYFFSEKLGLLYKSPLSDFNFQSVNILRLMTGYTRAADKWKFKGVVRVGNTDSLCYESVDSSNVFRGTAAGGYLSGEKRLVETVALLYLSKDIPVSKTVSRLLAQLQGTKDLGKLPLKEVTIWNTERKSKTNLQLVSYKRAVIAEEKGLAPKGYRETTDLNDITNMDKSSAEELLCK